MVYGILAGQNVLEFCSASARNFLTTASSFASIASPCGAGMSIPAIGVGVVGAAGTVGAHAANPNPAASVPAAPMNWRRDNFDALPIVLPLRVIFCCSAEA